MSDANFTTSATGGGLIAFLDYAIGKGYLKVSTGQALKTSVKEVLSSTEGEEDWESVDLDSLDVDDTLRRFETLRAMKFSTGSLNTYKGRFQRSFKMFEDFRASPGTWRPSVKTRKRTSAGSVETSTAATSSDEAPVATSSPAVTPAATAHASTAHAHRATIITYPFPLREGVLASVELPADLTAREAKRLASFIGSLAIEEPSESNVPDQPNTRAPE